MPPVDPASAQPSSNNKPLPAHLSSMKPTQRSDNTGPKIDQNICIALEECWHNPFSKEEILELLDVQVCPENAEALKLLEVNEVKMTKTD